MSSLVLQQARSYVKRGWSVIPINPKSKTPAIPSWKEFQERFPTDQELAQWFDGANANRNIAVVTGKISSIVVLDFDGPEGMNTLHTMGVRSTIMSSTGKGKHLVFQRPEEGRGNSVRTLPGMDIRGDGGYVIVAPSIHPSGRRYAWVLDAMTPPKFPETLLGATVAQAESKNPTGWVSDALAGMQVGNIDNTLFKICSRLRRDGYTKEDALVLLAPHAAEAGATPDHLPAKIDHVWGTYEAEGRSGALKGVKGSDLLSSHLTTEWAIKNLLPTPGILFLVGMQGIGKTWMTLDMATTFSTAPAKWLGLFDVPKPMRVLYIDDESSQNLLADRLRLITSGRSFNPELVEFVIKPGLDLRNENDLSAVSAKVEEFGAQVLVLDSYSCFHIGDDNSSEHTLNMMSILKKLASKYGLAIVVVDHMATAAVFDKTRLKTSNDIAGNKIKARQADSMISLEKADGLVAATHTKSRYCREVPPFFVRLNDGPGFVYPEAKY